MKLSRTFAAQRDRIFDAWADPDLLARWWAPPGFTMGHATLDVRKGGCFRIGMTAPNGSQVFAVGMVEQVRRPELLVFLWEWRGWDPGGPAAAGVSRVTLELHERLQATELILVQEGLPSDEIARRHKQGWRECLDRMARVVQ